MKRLAVSLGSLTVLLVSAAAKAEDKPPILDVWPGTPPGEGKPIAEEKMEESKGVKRITNVSKPTLTVYRPAKDKDTGVAVVICPGGGYNILAWDLEGQEVAAWLNSIGVTGIILKYRVPRRPDQAKDKPPIGPLQDAQRALSLVRGKAGEWKIDPKRIGILGFSAGGHLAAAAATNFDKRSYESLDDTDKISCRPDFAVLIYPGYLVGKDKEHLNADIRVRKECPPMFFAHASNDPVPVENSVQMYLALKRAGVPAELHAYAKGGHGFGLRPSQNPCSTWPTRCADWMRSQDVLKGEKAARAPGEDRQRLLKEMEARIAAAKSDATMWEERAAWSERMSRPSRRYVTVAQAEADRARLKAAQERLEELQRQRNALELDRPKP